MKHRIPLLPCAALAILLGCVATGASVSEPLPGPVAVPESPYYYGVLAHPWTIGYKTRRIGNQNVPDDSYNAYVDRILDSWKSMGVRYVRIDYPGYMIVDRLGNANFATEDNIAQRLAERGITELPVCLQYGASRSDNPAQKLWSSPGAYADFCATVASHLRERFPQISRFELMNEPNQTYWWVAPAASPYADQSGAAAASYLAQAYRAVKARNPNLTIVAPALGDGGRHSVNAFAYLETLYRNGCKTGSCWDVLSIHNYAWEDPRASHEPQRENQWANYKYAQAIAAKFGDRVPHVMLTEVGFCHGRSSECQSPVAQAEYMDAAFNLILRDPTVDGITWQNGAHPEGDSAFTSINCETDALKPYPCFFVFRRFSNGPPHEPIHLNQDQAQSQ